LRLGLLFALFVGCAGAVHADQLEIAVQGVGEPMHSNLRNRVQGLHLGGSLRLTRRRQQQLAEQAEREAALALRPYGYYHAQVESEWTRAGEDTWRLQLRVDPGAPLTIAESVVEVTGPGAELAELQEWKRQWPLAAGRVMDQTAWEAGKEAALDLAETHGYLGAAFTEHVIEINLETNTAATRLVLDTGERAVMGEVRYEQEAVRPGILELLPRFSAGQPYDPWLLEKFRLDLWRTGYFENVQVLEERRLEEDPPTVHLVVRAESRSPNTYQGSLGWGTDTGIRAQVQWSRYLLSERGDYFDLGVGWQEEFNQYSLRSSYRLPRETRAREFWTADALINRQRQDVLIRQDDDVEEYIQLTSGNVTDYSVKGGRLIVRDLERGYSQIFETWYGQYVLETVSFELTDLARDLGYGEPDDALGRYDNTVSALAFGVNWDWPDVRGSGFETVGHHQRAWVLAANESWGSRREFVQAYLSSSWQRQFGERWKLLLRGEVGYTDADYREVDVDFEGQSLHLSVTELPNLYRFKAGGSRSVRGYDFESLSNNNIGSNNIVTASVEMEYLFRPRWSVAAFFDAGNAFNDWDDYELRKGAGVGIRWYSIAGAIRLDVAQGLDLTDEPWRLHFTIGTPLL
jgi:translocation and assembly module TamA